MFMQTAHRPWPMPQQPWVMSMRWHDLLFMHWPISSAAIRPYIPRSLEIDTFEGTAWIGIVPFRMSNVTPRFVPPLPGVSAFPEINVRTYVTVEGKPGVWFISLDAGHPLAVEAARDFFHLPYYNAQMTCELVGDDIQYASTRTHRHAAPATFAGYYRPTSAAYHSIPGTLESWLTERYCLYAANRQGYVWRSDIHHVPWPLQSAEAEVQRNTMTEQIKLALPTTQPLLHFARSLDVVAWWPQRLHI